MVKEYKYQLDKSSRKFLCPECKQKRFVRYIDTDTKEYLPEHFGRCDRESSCGNHNYPKKERFQFPTPKRKETGNLISISYLPFELMDKSVTQYANCNIYLFLEKTFGEEPASQMCRDYFIGSNKYGDTVFWQIDIIGNVRQAKVMQYDPETGRRNKATGAYFAGKKILNDTSAHLEQCFFGEYWLNQAPINRPVAIVESEKTAVIASVYYPEYIWLATGGKTGCKWTEEKICKVLKGRKVILFPDLNAYDIWKTKGKLMEVVADCKVAVSHLLEEYASEEDRKKGLDLADYILWDT